VCYIVDHVAVQTDVGKFARIKFTQRNLGLVLNAKSAEESKNFSYDHFITYFKPADFSAPVQITGMFSPKVFRMRNS
jgi:VIT1/CCC1 family predicted Fe2+/Mn2+ transporter|tara:strand:- start:1279 stop:1509 length:231 start_codon:yes stop_codon:yes gene_type:complete